MQTKEKIERVNKAWTFLKSFIVKVVDELSANVNMESFSIAKFRQIPSRSRFETELGECQWIGYNYDHSTMSDNQYRFSDNPSVFGTHEPIGLVDASLIFVAETKGMGVAGRGRVLD